MRQYRYEATAETIEALRQLRGAWAAYDVEREAFTVALMDGRTVRITVEQADVEPDFDGFRLSAVVLHDGTDRVLPPVWGAVLPTEAPMSDAPPSEAPDFAVGRNDVVLVAGATWIEGPLPGGAAGEGAAGTHAGHGPPGGHAAMQFSGGVGQVSATASVVCVVTDAFVVASPLGTGFLVRTGVQPRTLDVTDDSAAIARFLQQRGYAGG